MITHYKYDDLGAANHGWLDSRFHFSFADYHNPERMHFGALRVINDDLIAPDTGFDPHPHRNMEIITYVRSGAVLHRDSLGNSGETKAGDVQVMSAGTGIVHSEYSGPGDATRLYQIWIIPNARDVTPRWDQAQFPKAQVSDQLKLLVSGRADDQASGALYIHADARIFGGVIAPGATIKQSISIRSYVLIATGTAVIDGVVMVAGDGAEVTAQDTMMIVAGDQGAEVVVIDLDH